MDIKVRLAFYKVQEGDLFGRLISIWTGIFNPNTPEYSHVEIGFLIDGEWRYFSSASKNTSGTSGTRWLDGDVLLKNRDRWDVYSVNPIRSQKDMIQDCDNELGKPYDWLGVFGFVTLFGLLNNKNKWYCSEVCYFIFFGIWKKRVSPRRLYSVIKGYIDEKL